MSTAAAPVVAKGVGVRVIQSAALVVVLGLLFLATRIAPETRGMVGAMAGLGVLLLAGTLTSELCEIVGLPHLSGYLIAGLVVGPYVLSLVDVETVARLSPVNTFTLALIALAGGAELRLAMLRRTARSVGTATAVQSTLLLVACAASFFAFAKMTPFANFETKAVIGVSLLWGVVAISRSPAALLGIYSQVRPKGPLTEFSLAFVMLSDVVVIVIATLAITLLRPLLDSDSVLSAASIKLLVHELVGSISLGVTLGLLLAGYLRLVGKNLLLVLLLLGVGLSELLRYIHFDPMLAFLTAGFVVENFSDQGHSLLEGVERTGAVVYVIFFALAGAQLDVPILLSLWPVALGLCVLRGIGTVLGNELSARVAKDPPAVRRWGSAALIPQSGLTLGLSLIIVRSFPSIGDAFHSLVIASCAINTLVGPIILKLALERTGEAGQAGAEEEPRAENPQLG